MSLFNITNHNTAQRPDEATIDAAKMMASLSISKDSMVHNNSAEYNRTNELQELKDKVARLEAENNNLAARKFYDSAQVADAAAKFRTMEDENATLRRQVTALSGFLSIVLPLFVTVTRMFEGVIDTFRQGFAYMVSILSELTSHDVSQYGWIASALPSLPFTKENYDALLEFAKVMEIPTTANVSFEQLHSSLDDLRASLADTTTPRSSLFVVPQSPSVITFPYPVSVENKPELYGAQAFFGGAKHSPTPNYSSFPSSELEAGIVYYGDADAEDFDDYYQDESPWDEYYSYEVSEEDPDL